MLISYVIVTYKRDEALQQCLNSICAQDYRPLEIIVVDNGGGATISLPDKADLQLQVLRPEQNLGAAGGRNLGMKTARGEIYILLDDDAYLIAPDSTRRVLDLFRQCPRCGAISFRSLDTARRVIASEFPHPNKVLIQRNEVFEVPYFYAMGHAFKAEVIAKVGGYSEYIFYLMEEYELSLRVVDAGYTILYDPRTAVIHDKAQTGRDIQGAHWWYLMALNKARSAFLKLPMPYPWTILFIWGGRLLLHSRLNFILAAKMYRALWADRNYLRSHRQPISPDAVRYLKSVGARLLF